MKNEPIVLIVDDEVSIRKNMNDLMRKEGYTPIEAISGEDAILKAKSITPNLILLDINLNQTDGFTILSELKKIHSDVPVIMFTAYGTSERAIQAMKAGAFDYIEKPFELDEFLILLQRALSYRELVSEVMHLRNQTIGSKTSFPIDQLVGKSSKMQEIFKVIGKVAQMDTTVFIQGESGTGKELIADAIQKHSLRSNKPFIKINCGALPENLLESEIFGHEKGSFTGAISQHLGRFELADEGTIFLDEINSMSPSLQVRLLRILQQKKFERVGGKETISVNVRIIAATNKDINKEISEGRFREDLFYRLNVVKIIVPPLRDRIDDLPVLVEHFLKKYSPDRQIIISPESMKELMAYSWPGNTRELENVIQSALVMAHENIITINQLPSIIHSEEVNISFEKLLKDGLAFKDIIAKIERDFITKALFHSNGNRSLAAKLLKINRRLLYSKMAEHDIK